MTSKSLLSPKLEAMRKLTQKKYIGKICSLKDADKEHRPYCASWFGKFGCTRGKEHIGLHHHHGGRRDCRAIWEDEKIKWKPSKDTLAVVHWQGGWKENQYAFCGHGRKSLTTKLEKVTCKLCKRRLEAL